MRLIVLAVLVSGCCGPSVAVLAQRVAEIERAPRACDCEGGGGAVVITSGDLLPNNLKSTDHWWFRDDLVIESMDNYAVKDLSGGPGRQ